MTADEDLRHELYMELKKLDRSVADLRQNNASPETIQQTTQPFQVEWVTRLVRQEETHRAAKKEGIEEAAQALFGPPTDIQTARDQARLTIVIIEQADRTNEDTYTQLRSDFGKALQQIDEGREFNFPLQQDRKIENTPAPPPHSDPLKEQVQARMRAIYEKEQARKPDLDRSD